MHRLLCRKLLLRTHANIFWESPSTGTVVIFNVDECEVQANRQSLRMEKKQ
jgi:hypothetical protein